MASLSELTRRRRARRAGHSGPLGPYQAVNSRTSMEVLLLEGGLPSTLRLIVGCLI